MSQQSFRTIDRDERKAQSVTRSPTRAGAVLWHEMTVIASNVADVVASAGGWLFDRRMAGWNIDVLVADRAGGRALDIVGVRTLDLTAGCRLVCGDRDRAASLAVAADVYAADAGVRREFASAARRGLAEVAFWGRAEQLDHDVRAVHYRLSSAARAFKAQALRAAGLPDDAVAATETLLRGGVTAIAPAAVRS